jgi:hypothetical protein
MQLNSAAHPRPVLFSLGFQLHALDYITKMLRIRIISAK